MPSDEVLREVAGDVRDGLGAVFAAADEGFEVREGFAEGIGDDRVAAVPWSYTCVHTGDFEGMFPTGRRLRIEGITVLDRRAAEPAYIRYVDWAGVFVQLGMGVSPRVGVTDDEYAYGRERFAELASDAD